MRQLIPLFMKQLLQNLNSGSLTLETCPSPNIIDNHLLIETTASLISIGTEKMLLNFGKSNLIAKAKQQPDKVKQVIQKMKTDGIAATLNSVQAKLNTPIPLGYSNVGKVIGIGNNVEGFKVGDKVVSNGPHAQFVNIPKNLCVKIPESVSDIDATFTVTGSIGLQGVRLLKPELGESIAVIGLGLIGLLVVQILQANGCNVIGFDYDQKKLKIAKDMGIETVDLNTCENPVSNALNFTNQKGIDGVIITASTSSDSPLQISARMCRKRGRVVLVGVIGNSWSRDDFYKKEISFQVSCSYGPGRYEPEYEQKGLDYPIEFVRWTEKRNFEAFLNLIEQNKINISDLITKQVKFENLETEYDGILSDKNQIGVVINYPTNPDKTQQVSLNNSSKKSSNLNIACIGAGGFTSNTLLPKLKKLKKLINNISLDTIVSKNGLSAQQLGKKHTFNTAASSEDSVFENKNISTIFVTTQHNSHSQLLIKALKSNKNAYIEKPLCLNENELKEIEKTYENSNNIVMVGFNRRFSPFSQKIKSLLKSEAAPKTLSLNINSGDIPADHWIHDPILGGGRLIGEGIHFIDLARYLIGSPITSVYTTSLENNDKRNDNFTIQLTFKDGSIATIHYWSNGSKDYPKEQLSMFSNGKILELDNFKSLKGYGFKNFKSFKTKSQEKGHYESFKSFLESVDSGKESPIPFDEIREITRVSFLAIESLNNKKVISI
jgi:predicted dehydrogenase/threonine dehydrogenase-like Zn-dependent dehydrogenase